VLGHRSGPEHLFFLPPQALAISVRYPEMKESNLGFPIAALDPFHPAFRSLGPWSGAPQILDVEVAARRSATRLVGRCPGSGLEPRSGITALYTPSESGANAELVGKVGGLFLWENL
jgi:hypothetical protein